MTRDDQKIILGPTGIVASSDSHARDCAARTRRTTMGGILTGAAVAESMSLTGGAAASASASSGAIAGVTTALGSAGAVVTDAVGSLGTYTVAVGTYTITAPVVLLATIGVMMAGLASYVVVRRVRGTSGETASLLRASAYGTAGADNMV